MHFEPLTRRELYSVRRFAEEFISSANLSCVFFGYFIPEIRTFSKTWEVKSQSCSIEDLQKLQSHARQRLAVFCSISDISPLNGAVIPAYLDQTSFPAWSTLYGYEVGIGRPINGILPVVCFESPREKTSAQPALFQMALSCLSLNLAKDTSAPSVSHYEVLQNTLKVLSIEFLIVDADGMVIQDGRSKKSHRCRFKIVRDHLTLGVESEREALTQAIRGATSAEPCVSITYFTDECQQARMAVIAPFGEEGEGLAIVLFENKFTDHWRLREHFFEAYELTRSERYVAHSLLDGMTVTESAEATGFSLSTVRTYLRRIFLKTGTHRQSELIGLYYQSILPVSGYNENNNQTHITE